MYSININVDTTTPPEIYIHNPGRYITDTTPLFDVTTNRNADCDLYDGPIDDSDLVGYLGRDETVHRLVISPLTPGTYTYYVNQTVNNCTSSNTTVDLIINDLPVVNKVALITAKDSSSNLLCQVKESFQITGGQTTDSGNFPLGIAIIESGTDKIFEPTSILVPSGTSLYFQNWTNSSVTVTGYGPDMTIPGVSVQSGQDIFSDDNKTITGTANMSITGFPGSSYGSAIPVMLVISPAPAFLMPFGIALFTDIYGDIEINFDKITFSRCLTGSS